MQLEKQRLLANLCISFQVYSKLQKSFVGKKLQSALNVVGAVSSDPSAHLLWCYRPLSRSLSLFSLLLAVGAPERRMKRRHGEREKRRRRRRRRGRSTDRRRRRGSERATAVGGRRRRKAGRHSKGGRRNTKVEEEGEGERSPCSPWRWERVLGGGLTGPTGAPEKSLEATSDALVSPWESHFAGVTMASLALPERRRRRRDPPPPSWKCPRCPQW